MTLSLEIGSHLETAILVGLIVFVVTQWWRYATARRLR